MRSTRVVFVFFAVLAASGCYHATIDTGLAPSGQTVKKEWAHSFIAGLVPPSAVETASKCPNGVAKVETQLSFLNMVASAVTFGIYSPMTISVECAAARTSSLDAEHGGAVAVPHGASHEAMAAAISEAANQAREKGAPVFVFFE